MPSFVSEVDDLQPKALLISDQHVLAVRAIAWLREANFDVTWWGRASSVVDCGFSRHANQQFRQNHRFFIG